MRSLAFLFASATIAAAPISAQRSELWVDPKSGTGIAYFTTAVPDDAPRGKTAFYAIEEAIISER